VLEAHVVVVVAIVQALTFFPRKQGIADVVADESSGTGDEYPQGFLSLFEKSGWRHATAAAPPPPAIPDLRQDSQWSAPWCKCFLISLRT
jgi:hypothetical protein